MRINIICDEASGGWIYSEFIYHIKKHSQHEILINEKDENKFDLYYFIPYYNYFKSNKPSMAWFSHQEQKDPLKSRFINVGKSVDMSISHSKKYADILKDNGIVQVKQIIPGVDLDLFKIREVNRSKNDKLIVGYSGRNYVSSARKNPQLIKHISNLPFVDFRSTGGKLEASKVPMLIQNCDIIVQPSLVEGGSMAVQQSLACGVPIICFEGVGVADEFGQGVIKVPFGNNKDFLSQLGIIWKTKSYLEWRKPERMNQMREQVKDQTWENFVLSHDKIWETL